MSRATIDLLKHLPKYKVSMTLSHNDHKSYYETVEQCYVDQIDTFVSVEEYTKACETDSVWEIQWYPDTPVGFCLLRAATLEVLLEAVNASNN